MKHFFVVGMKVIIAAFILVLISASSLAYAGDVTSEKGFLGRPWGARPGDFEGARYIADIAPQVVIYSADVDMSPLLGSVEASTPLRLVFAEEGGLVKARVVFDPREYTRVYQHLTGVLGEPVPIVYELWAGKIDFAERSEWRVAGDTNLILTSWLTVAAVEIGKRDSISLEGRKFEERLAAALQKQAQNYEKQNRIPEASSIYQELLNGADVSRLYIGEAQERLAAYSRRTEAVKLLAKYKGYVFSRLENVFPGVAHQLWLRIDFEDKTRSELQQLRPDNIGPTDRLLDIAAVLCRVRAVPTASKYVVVDQIWLDSANHIIGSRSAGMPQDTSWPASYITKACEGFLVEWFTIGSITGPALAKAED